MPPRHFATPSIANGIPPPTLQQQYMDLAMAHSELRTARNRLFEISELVKLENSESHRRNVSVYYAERQVEAAESLLNELTAYYNSLDLDNAELQGAAPTSPINTMPVVIISDSDSDDDEPSGAQAQNSSPGAAPAYSSWPSTPPHFYAALFQERQSESRASATPSTPSRGARDIGGAAQPSSPPPSTQPRRAAVPGAAQPLSPPPSTQPRQAAVATQSYVNTPPITIVGQDGVLTSPEPKKKHYVITRGRRTGIYRSWTTAKGYVAGLGSEGASQGFDTYQQAFDAYMDARDRGLLRVIRLEGDTVARYGELDRAEDL